LFIFSEKKTVNYQPSFSSDQSEKKIPTRGNIQIVSKETLSDIQPKKEEVEKIPDEIMLKVPFLSQAPFANWDALHEDACEETSLIMLKYFSDQKTTISKDSGEKEIQTLVKYEEKNGYGVSITLKELAQVAGDFFGMKNSRIEYNVSVEDIKKELAFGKPVIIPAAGKILPNPNFRNGGPVYHMLVLKGYDRDGFISNDPGTRKGEGFRYTFEDLFFAIHDWNGQDILKGQKAYLVFD